MQASLPKSRARVSCDAGVVGRGTWDNCPALLHADSATEGEVALLLPTCGCEKVHGNHNQDYGSENGYNE